jgi:hypothetical protein
MRPLNRGGFLSLGGREKSVGREIIPGFLADSKAICLSGEGAPKLERIVILTEQPQENDRLVVYLRSVFPDCDIELLSRPAALREVDGVDPQGALAGNGKKKGTKF